MVKVEIKTVKMGEIKLNPDNPRTISKKDMALLVKSLKDFPEMLELREIVVDEGMTILGGNMRYLALQKVGVKEATAKVVTGLTPAQKREFIVKDNAAFGDWNMEDLANSWADLPLADWGVDLPEDWLGGDKGEPADAEPQIDRAEELNKVWRVTLGDLWQIGEHRLLCGDSTKKEDVGRVMGEIKADMVFTDPPYGIEVENTRGKIENDESLDVFEKFQPISKGFLKPSSHIYIFFGSKRAAESLAILNKHFKQFNIIVFPITNQTQPYPEGYFSSNYELCYFSQHGGIKAHNSGIVPVSETTKKDNRYDGDGFLKKYYCLSEMPVTEHNINTVHPTQKKANTVAFYVEISSKKGEFIYDPFLGSGTTMVACQNLNRKCRGIEISPDYCAVILQRMHDAFPDLEIRRVE